MSTAELINALAAAILLLIFGILSLLNRGFLFNNAHLFSSKEERETMDKKPCYRQTAIVFLLLSAAFMVVGISLLLRDSRIALLEIPILIAAVTYAVVSSALIAKWHK